MEKENDNIESDAHESLIYSLLAPPPSPLHQQGFLNAPDREMRGSEKSVQTASRWDTLSTKGQRESLADELSSSLAIIAREERRKVGNDSLRSGRQTRGESDEGGDASEESWISFLGAQSNGVPVVTAATSSSSEDRYTYSSRGRASSIGDAAHSHGLPTCIDVHGLPKPVDDRVGHNHGNSPAVVVARLPPPQCKSYSGSSTSMPSSGSDKGRSGDEEVHTDRHARHYHAKRAHSAMKTDGVGTKSDDRHAHHHVRHAPSARRTDDIYRKGDHQTMHMSATKAKRLRISLAAIKDLDGRGSSSGSGTEGGYDASVSSPSVSSWEDGQDGDKRHRRRKEFMNGLHYKRKNTSSNSVTSSGSMCSELADLSSSPELTSDSFSIEANGVKPAAVETNHPRKCHHGEKHVMSRYERLDVIPPVASNLSSKIQLATQRRHQDHRPHQLSLRDNYESALVERAATEKKPVACQGAAIFSVGCDMMAHCLTFLGPLEVHSLLTTPLSKQWRNDFTMSQDLWRVLCLMEPFKAKYGPEDLNTDESASSFASQSGPDVKHLFGRYRLLYTSFIRCLRYLTQIKDDAIHGRSPSVLDYGGSGLNSLPLTTNASLRQFLAKARHTLNNNKHQSIAAAAVSEAESFGRSNSPFAIAAAPVGVSDVNTLNSEEPMKKKAKRESSSTAPRVQYGHSQLTQRLLGPSMDGGTPGNVNLPWSCAIYSIVNWMVAFSDVEGIQTMCLKVLPNLLEDESQRTTAQSAGLTDIVLRGMVVFPDSVELHTAAFHTIVLLARPIGGREGMLFRSSLVNSSGIFNNGSQSGRNGIAVMLDSMHRFENEDILQAMSCWSLVNVALAPSQKSMLVKLGGIAATANAMVQHPYNAEVQFRALFALINLVIPSAGQSDDSSVARDLQEQLGEVNQTAEKDMLDESVGQITTLVVQAMKHFCSSESILNRACLVLHNLSLTTEYHTTLLWTPSCYQMLEWCLANYRTDLVLQQSAAGTLHRLQQTLSSHGELRHQFTSFLQSQQQHSLEQAHEEAVLLHEQQEKLLSRRSGADA